MPHPITFLLSIADSPDPIFRQIADQVRRSVVGGKLSAGDLMPSAREVAKALGINPMTVSRAYSDLCAAGVLVRRRGARMAVAAHPYCSITPDRRLAIVRPELERAVVHARQAGLNNQEILEIVTDLIRSHN